MAAICASVFDGSSPRARGTPRTRCCVCSIRRFIPAGAGNTCRVAGVTASVAVHPRGRGEHAFSDRSVDLSAGSSPRARGTPGSSNPTRIASRFIPAGAGNTAWCTSRMRLSAVHPRGRGEHYHHAPRLRLTAGSSPRARGTRGRARVWQSRCAVHPRGRGEHVRNLRAEDKAGGSSPRARGTPGTARRWWSQYRFIPAGAGNTSGRG